MHKMSPFVHITVGQQVHNTQPCHHGGKEPHWPLSFMEIPTNMFQNHMHIVIKDQGHPMKPIAEANVPLSIFTGFGPKEEMIQLNTGGFVLMRSEFIGMGHGGPAPVVVVQQPNVMHQQPQVVMQQQPHVVVQQQPMGFVMPREGYLRLHIQNAHLDVNRGGPMNK